MDNHFGDYYSHPGVRIEELLRKSSMTHGSLASKLNVSSYRLRTLLKGSKAVDLELALKLACLFPEHTARDWLDMQTAYELYHAYTSGKMDGIARQMNVEPQKIYLKTDWLKEYRTDYGSIEVPVRRPVNYKIAALAEKLKKTPQEVALEAIEQLWERMDQGDDITVKRRP